MVSPIILLAPAQTLCFWRWFASLGAPHAVSACGFVRCPEQFCPGHSYAPFFRPPLPPQTSPPPRYSPPTLPGIRAAPANILRYCKKSTSRPRHPPQSKFSTANQSLHSVPPALTGFLPSGFQKSPTSSPASSSRPSRPPPNDPPPQIPSRPSPPAPSSAAPPIHPPNTCSSRSQFPSRLASPLPDPHSSSPSSSPCYLRQSFRIRALKLDKSPSQFPPTPKTHTSRSPKSAGAPAPRDPHSTFG